MSKRYGQRSTGTSTTTPVETAGRADRAAHCRTGETRSYRAAGAVLSLTAPQRRQQHSKLAPCWG
jgi:hypothetical protein